MSVPCVPSKWRIVYGSPGFALSEIHSRLCAELGENIPCVPAESFVPETPEQSVLLLGTPDDNSLLAKYGERLSSLGAEGYIIKTEEGFLSEKGQTLVIAGADQNGVIYGVMDFLHNIADRLAYGKYYREKRYRPFAEPLEALDISSRPSVAKRGIWTWGRCIYDYRGFFDNMARTKLNTAVIWNDVPPVNGREVVNYAHSRGIKVLWGFSWGWSTECDVDISDPEELKFWCGQIISDYENKWAPLGGDGIYFQTATECDEKDFNGRPLAACVVDWVNGIASALYEKHPTLDIEFGLHATAVKASTEYLENVDPRLTITWENGGAFPFAYHAWDTEGFEETCELTDKMLALRGENEKAGFVFKGVSTLFWPEFMAARDGFVLGQASQEQISRVFEKARGEIRTEQAWWLENLGCLTEIARRAVASGAAKGSVTLLCEDGCFERARWMPCVLFGETLWDVNADPKDVIRRASLSRDAVFA